VTFTYVLNDFDPIDGLPQDLQKKFTQYLGFPLRTAPSPESGYQSFADYFTKDFQKVLNALGVGATFLYSWDLYHEGRFNDVIRIALNSAEKILDIYQSVSGSKKREKGWLPLQVICEKCGKLGTTRVHRWNGTTVTYTCEPAMVKWAVGCGYTGEISPFDGNGKLPWKVDWPAHWKVIGVTIEGAGKDHSSAGGSRDIARELCKSVFRIPEPFNLPYEFFLIGGKKMASSKGLGLKARELTSLLPPAIARFLFTRTDYRQSIEFNPFGSMVIPDLFDEYDRCYHAYITGGDQNLVRTFELSQISELPEKKELFLPRFRDVANFVQQPSVNLVEKFAQIKGSQLTKEEELILNERETYARVWIENYAPDDFRYQLTETLSEDVKSFSKIQKDYLKKVRMLLNKIDDPEKLQKEIYNAAKEIEIQPKDAFAAIYITLIGKKFGPKAAWLLLHYPKNIINERLSQATSEIVPENTTNPVHTISKPNYFVIDSSLKNKYPSISIGIGVIKNVTVRKNDDTLMKEKNELVEKMSSLPKEAVNKYSEIISYRKLYREMGIDWHSRRPSPEALLRRIIQGKGLYTVNTCVDAYNLVVIHNRVSVGVFDADMIKFPTILRYANEGDKIILLGDESPTIYTSKEIAYYDQIGGYNIDFNYRDAKRSMVTEKTKNIWINVDGIYDIIPEQVEKTLRESIEKILQYCGGTVEFSGIII